MKIIQINIFLNCKTDFISIVYSDTYKLLFTVVLPHTTNITPHSLRAGGASAAAENGVPDRQIPKHGRWKSENARNGYILDSVKNRSEISKKLGL